ncbi:YolA family protein [Salipaludibacillus sp. LMS25]|uniref:DUF4879 domain-containing protein n=1 Tax=Salipaludibacillus sp. LMS25 TaxID=2924031 RepID=UPI0020D0FEA1|nr:DUF4879 domain-containing protein [Salipaludibacillus sp. LMS25]UTR15701.1 YolA family protein [Salipaludibacillus sp. LMS25]
MTLVFLGVGTFDSVEAGPAPPLTYMNIEAITSDGGGFEWHYPDQEYMSTGYTASGSEIYIVTYVEGYTSGIYPMIFVDGENVTDQTYRTREKQYLSGSDNIIYGYLDYRTIPLELFEGQEQGVITLFARDLTSPLNTLSVTRSFNIDWN